MQYRYSRYISWVILIIDFIILNVSFSVSYYYLSGSFDGLNAPASVRLFAIVNGVWAVLLYLGKPQEISRTTRLAEVIRNAIRFILLHLLVISAVFVLLNELNYGRNFLILSYGIFSLLLLSWRIGFTYLIRIYRKFGYNVRNVAIVGSGEISEELKKFFRLHPEFGYRFIGLFDDSDQGNFQGRISEIKSFSETVRIDEIYCCLPYVPYSGIQDLIDFGEKNFIKVKLLADFRGFKNKGIAIENYDSIPVLNVLSLPLDFRKNRAVKRIFDVCFSLLVIVTVFSWLFPIIALAIFFDSKGPIFFRQKRSGKNNNDFWCWKFRTMYVNDTCDVEQARRNDRRVTRVGAFLRRTSLDELPQFFNVLVGNMSVVGPRPHMLHHTEEYSRKVERFMARHFVKPGVTGLAQAKGYRGETADVAAMKNRVKFDRFYIQNWTPVLDLKIIILTILSLFRKNENAY